MAPRKTKTLQIPGKTLAKLSVTAVSSEACSKAWTILKHTHDSSISLHQAYKLARAVRGLKREKDGTVKYVGTRGMSTDEEQDLLRAMLVTAASGLDAIAKQIIRDALPTLITFDALALDGLEKFVRRRIRGELEDGEFDLGGAFLARILCAPSIHGRLIEDYIGFLTGGSLQSVEELYKVAAALGMDPQEVGIDRKALQPIFDCRNKIIHELDINLEAERRNRNVRREGTMVNYTNTMIRLAEKLLTSVDKKTSTAA